MQSAAPSSPLRLSPRRTWFLLFILFTLIAFFTFGYVYLDDLTRQHSGTLSRRLLEQITGAYSAFVLLPLILRYARSLVFSSRPWFARVGFHLLGATVYSAVHTTMMAVSRWTLAPLLGMGSYDYGIMRFRYPMEYSNDLVGFTIIVVLYYFYERLKLAQAQQLAAAELQTRLAQSQLENLRLQVQPHFLFNTLNTISAVMYEDVRAADAMLSQLSDLLRLTLRSSSSHELPLEQELQITRRYLELMQRRFESKLSVSYDIDSSLLPSFVPQLILQPLVENSLRHGMKSGDETMQLAISAHRDNGSMILKVSDTGAGLSASTHEAPTGGIGLANIRDRLAHLYGANAGLTLQNRDSGGVEASVRLPFHISPYPALSPE
ncbi:MAG TPA: histidine kinase [Candidatus Acidoferrum sp.]|nr:histidine kinase [Candidatus Acidoferrum sp.]